MVNNNSNYLTDEIPWNITCTALQFVLTHSSLQTFLLSDPLIVVVLLSWAVKQEADVNNQMQADFPSRALQPPPPPPLSLCSVSFKADFHSPSRSLRGPLSPCTLILQHWGLQPLITIMIPSVTLNNGAKMPIVGLGTWRVKLYAFLSLFSSFFNKFYMSVVLCWLYQLYYPCLLRITCFLNHCQWGEYLKSSLQVAASVVSLIVSAQWSC